MDFPSRGSIRSFDDDDDEFMLESERLTATTEEGLARGDDACCAALAPFSSPATTSLHVLLMKSDLLFLPHRARVMSSRLTVPMLVISVVVLLCCLAALLDSMWTSVDSTDSSTTVDSERHAHPTTFLSRSSPSPSSSSSSSSSSISSSSSSSSAVSSWSMVSSAFGACGLWPGRVDLMVRAYSGSAVWLQLMLRSVELFWPRDIGRVILVMDVGRKDEAVVHALVPDWVDVYYEEVPEEMAHNGRWAQQWHDMWADNYTAQADYVAIADTDSLLLQPVTPDLLFDREGRVIHLVASNLQRGLFDDGTKWWLGNTSDPSSSSSSSTVPADLHALYPLNFMQNLPLLFPVSLFSAFRQHVTASKGALHFNDVNRRFLDEYTIQPGTEPSQFCILGSYWQYFSPAHLQAQLHVQRPDRMDTDTYIAMVDTPVNVNVTSSPPSAALMDAVYNVTLRVGYHVKWVYGLHTPYHDFIPRVVQMINAGLSMWTAEGEGASDDEQAEHLQHLLTYVNMGETMWPVAHHRLDLVTEHVYRARRRWLADMAREGRQEEQEGQEGQEAAQKRMERFIRTYPTPTAYDRQRSLEAAQPG